MEKDLGRINKNPETDIVIRVDDFGGKPGLTIREFVSSDKYTGFTKSGTRISAESFEEFKKIINSVNPEDLKSAPISENQEPISKQAPPKTDFKPKKQEEDVDEELSGVDEDGLM
ncbi:MAG: hypothetical protein Q8N88_01020 [Nanoarchaeota archaeon]|nr:hypothetical protein [Nanoarchaeota archaeon]